MSHADVYILTICICMLHLINNSRHLLLIYTSACDNNFSQSGLKRDKHILVLKSTTLPISGQNILVYFIQIFLQIRFNIKHTHLNTGIFSQYVYIQTITLKCDTLYIHILAENLCLKIGQVCYILLYCYCYLGICCRHFWALLTKF